MPARAAPLRSPRGFATRLGLCSSYTTSRDATPDIVEAILPGRQPEGMTLPGLMDPFPVEWSRQAVSLKEAEFIRR